MWCAHKLYKVMICLLVLTILFIGCAKKTNFQNPNTLNGGGTIIGNPGPYLPEPEKAQAEGSAEQNSALWREDLKLGPGSTNDYRNPDPIP